MSLTANMRAPSSTLGSAEHEDPLRMILTVRHPADPHSPDHGQDGRPVNGIAAHHKEMTMNKWIKRVSTAVASTALAGAALLGVSGTASAATASAPGAHTQTAITTVAAGGDRAKGYQSAHHEAQDDRWGAPAAGTRTTTARASWGRALEQATTCTSGRVPLVRGDDVPRQRRALVPGPGRVVCGPALMRPQAGAVGLTGRDDVALGCAVATRQTDRSPSRHRARAGANRPG